jgi:hypothetical protein
LTHVNPEKNLIFFWGFNISHGKIKK